MVILRDGVLRVDQCIRIVDQSPLQQRNAVVRPGLLVATGTLQMPERFPLAAEAGDWRLYDLHAGGASRRGPAWAAAYRGDDFALITLIEDARTDDPSAWIESLAAANPHPHALRQRLVWPDGNTARYPVIGGCNGEVTHRSRP